MLWDLPGTGLVIQGVKGCKEVTKNLTMSRDFSWLCVFSFVMKRSAWFFRNDT